MPTMVLTSDAKVSGKPQRAGHQFTATEKEARLWKALGRARSVDEVQTASLDTTPRSDSETPRSEPRRSGRYNRRDLRAEG